MGTRYHLYSLKCPYCKKKQEECYYAPSSGFLTHRCEFCKKKSIISHSQEFALQKATQEQIDSLYEDNGFSKT